MSPDLASPEVPVIRGKYLEDILDQPRALQATLENLDIPQPLEDLAQRLAEGQFRRIVLTGMGSSLHALQPLSLQLIDHGFTAVMVETSELVHYKPRLLDSETLTIAVSQSGQSAEIIRLAEVNQNRSAVIALTNTPQSPLAHHSSAALFTHAGSEFSVSCKTYITALMVLKFLGDILCQGDLEQSRRELKKAPSAADEYLSRWNDHVDVLARKLRRVGQLFLVGRGPSLAAVGTGALIIKESDHFHAEGMSSAAFRHGPFELLSGDTFVVVFSGDAKTRDLNRRLAADIQQAGGHAEFIGEDSPLDAFRLPEISESVRPILEILPVQMMTIALAALRNREAGKFERAAKITATE